MFITYLGCTEGQIRYGGHNDPRPLLRVGEEYEIVSCEVHSWHTKIELDGIDGRFNSTCFDVDIEDVPQELMTGLII